MNSGMRMWKGARAASFPPFLGVCARGGLTENIEVSKRASAAVKAELGIDTPVSVRTINGHTSVAVELAAPPSGDAATVKRQVTGIVTRAIGAVARG